MTSKYGRRDRCGPEYRPVCREDKIKEWIGAIRALVRGRDGTALTDEAANSYAEMFWDSLAARQLPVKEVMEIPGTTVVDWLLFVHSGRLIPAAVVVDQNPEGEL